MSASDPRQTLCSEYFLVPRIVGGMDGEVIVLRVDKKKAVVMLLASSAFVAAGISMIIRNEDVMVAWICALFFGLGVPVSIYMLMPGAGELRIDRNGIQMRAMFRPWKLSWSDINGFYVGRIRAGYASTKMIGIEYSDSYQKLRIGRQLANAMTGMQGALPNNFKCSAEEVCEVLNRAKKEWG